MLLFSSSSFSPFFGGKEARKFPRFSLRKEEKNFLFLGIRHVIENGALKGTGVEFVVLGGSFFFCKTSFFYNFFWENIFLGASSRFFLICTQKIPQ
jgi:hypothetical protein